MHLLHSDMSVQRYALFQVIRNPVSFHLPTGCTKVLMSFGADKVVHPKTLIPKDEPIVFVIGAMAHGSVSSVAYDMTRVLLLLFLNLVSCSGELRLHVKHDLHQQLPSLRVRHVLQGLRRCRGNLGNPLTSLTVFAFMISIVLVRC